MAQIDRYSLFVSRARFALVSIAVILLAALVYFIDPLPPQTSGSTEPNCPIIGFNFESAARGNTTIAIKAECVQYNNANKSKIPLSKPTIVLSDGEFLHQLTAPTASVFLDEKKLKMKSASMSGYNGVITLWAESFAAEFKDLITVDGEEINFVFEGGSGCARKFRVELQEASNGTTPSGLFEFRDGVRLTYDTVSRGRDFASDHEADVEPEAACLDKI